MIKKYKLRDLNRSPELHKEVFVIYSDMEELLKQIIQSALDNGVNAEFFMGSVIDDPDKLMEGVSDD